MKSVFQAKCLNTNIYMKVLTAVSMMFIESSGM
jgi:hypothetical protein